MYWKKKEEEEGDMNNDVTIEAVARGYTRMVGARKMNMAYAIHSQGLWLKPCCGYSKALHVSLVLLCAHTSFPTRFFSSAFVMQQPRTGVRGSSDVAMLSSLLNI